MQTRLWTFQLSVQSSSKEQLTGPPTIFKTVSRIIVSHTFDLVQTRKKLHRRPISRSPPNGERPKTSPIPRPYNPYSNGNTPFRPCISTLPTMNEESSSLMWTQQQSDFEATDKSEQPECMFSQPNTGAKIFEPPPATTLDPTLAAILNKCSCRQRLFWQQQQGRSLFSPPPNHLNYHPYRQAHKEKLKYSDSRNICRLSRAALNIAQEPSRWPLGQSFTVVRDRRALVFLAQKESSNGRLVSRWMCSGNSPSPSSIAHENQIKMLTPSLAEHGSMIDLLKTPRRRGRC